MKTLHQIFFKNAQNMKELAPGSVNLVVTSPPYPMIEMWDEMFSQLNAEIGHALKCNDGPQAYLLMNQELEKAARVADFFPVAKLMITDGLSRKESCGAHFREESQTDSGEAQRIDDQYSYVAAWEYTGENKEPVLHKEPLVFENVELKERSYK